MLRILKQIYGETWNILQLNNYNSEEFRSYTRVLQGNNISPTLFGEFIDGLIKEVKLLKKGIEIDSELNLSILAYADDIVLLANSAENLQDMLTVIDKWCQKWRVTVNTTKTKVLHFHHKKLPQTKHRFFLREN